MGPDARQTTGQLVSGLGLGQSHPPGVARRFQGTGTSFEVSGTELLLSSSGSVPEILQGTTTG